MALACTICNGLTTLQSDCPKCRQPVEDQGRLGDYYGPYSPYRPIDDIRLTNGFIDLRNHICIHVANCAVCNSTFLIPVNETEI